jgi:hypothetical protein
LHRTLEGWTRRRFLELTSAAAAGSALRLSALAQTTLPKPEPAGMPPPGVITGGIRPLLESNVARALRYTPLDGSFVIRNGRECFNRPLYGPISSFRVDAGDLPEFSLYLPGHGGNLKLGIVADAGSKWCAVADEVVARYRPGRMIYEIRDALLGKGTLMLELLTAGTGSGLLLKAQGENVAEGVSLAWAFGGASGRKGRRNGDIGCEVQPVAQFFQVRAEECNDNRYSLDTTGTSAAAALSSPAGELRLTFPEGSKLQVQSFDAWASTPKIGRQSSTASPLQPVLTGHSKLAAAAQYLTVQVADSAAFTGGDDPGAVFMTRSHAVEAIAGTLHFDTPDAYLNAAAPALAIAAEAIWDPKDGCVMHGAVAWRVALVGWRGPYVFDAIGQHERTRANLRHWLAKQNVSPVTTGDPATGPADPDERLARSEGLLHSNGDLSNNHYDMNLVFIDVLLRHLRWTGDLEFAREIWPALKRHLAWERRLFRREFTSASGEKLPLYEAYAAIWASDNLQYNGGGTAHGSAYNLFAHRAATEIARLLHEDPAPYEAEAALIDKAMQQLLWLPQQGALAESKDLLGPQTVYNNPALWTVYHTIDSEAVTPRQAWQMAAERLHTLRHVPVRGEGVPPGEWFMLCCSDWLPYMWSLNLLLLAENAHMALAMWQAGMADEAFTLLKSNLLDSLYRGLCPGDFHMTSDLDVHRQEAQRDFGDPIGITSRALIEGLFGVQPDLLGSRITLRPGFPSEWDRASLTHRDFDFAWTRSGRSETYSFTSRLPRAVPVTLKLRARTTQLPTLSGAEGARIAFDADAVGSPMLVVEVTAVSYFHLTLQWHGEAPSTVPAVRSYRLHEPVELPRGVALAQIDDPQQCLANGRFAAEGAHTVFAKMRQGDCGWSLPITFRVESAAPKFRPVPHAERGSQMEPVQLPLDHQLTTIFTRGYTEPRSPFCSLAIPDTLLGGWANIGEPIPIDDSGLRAANGLLQTGIGVPFRTPAGAVPNCAFLSCFKPDTTAITAPLSGRARGLYLLLTGTTLPQCSHMDHVKVIVSYVHGDTVELALRNPETWWPIEQDYLLDDYLFVNDAPLPPRVDLRSGAMRILDPVTFKGTGRSIPGGAATILHLPLDPTRELRSLKIEVELYGIVVAVLAATLER